jgi:hypothetical protein
MIRLASLVTAVIASLLLWHECGEDVGVFCYRIGIGAVTALRSTTLVPIPSIGNHVARTRTACSNPSSTFSTRSIAPRDFES